MMLRGRENVGKRNARRRCARASLIDGAQGETVFVHACRMVPEGIVAKRRDRPYRSGRCADWIKVKNPDASDN